MTLKEATTIISKLQTIADKTNDENTLNQLNDTISEIFNENIPR